MGGLPCIADDDMGFARFVATLTHDDRGSGYVIATKCASDEKWVERTVTAEALRGYDPSLLIDLNAYLTVNGFAGSRRHASALRQKNALVFDLDAHGGDHALVVPRAYEALTAAVASGLVPEPTTITYTGRGLQLVYVLKRSIPARVSDSDGVTERNNRTLDYARDVESSLDTTLEECVCSLVDGLEVDRRVHDNARVVRMPGTPNSKADGAYCRVVAHSGRLCTLAELKQKRPIPPVKPRKEEARKASGPEALGRALLRRMEGVERLVAHREAGGGTGPCINRCRNEALFIHHCAAVQVMDRDAAKARTMALNAAFQMPLPESEVASTIASVERKGYQLSNRFVMEHLGVTAEEAAAVGLLASKRAFERARAKEDTAAKRAMRDARIVDLRSEGLTQSEIADAVGCSRRTVSDVLKRAGLTRPRRPEGDAPRTGRRMHDSSPAATPQVCKKAPQEQGSDPKETPRRKRSSRPEGVPVPDAVRFPHAERRDSRRSHVPSPRREKSLRGLALRGPPAAIRPARARPTTAHASREGGRSQ